MEYKKNIPSKFTLKTQRKKYNKFNQFLISAMKGITKDHESIPKDYESLFLQHER